MMVMRVTKNGKPGRDNTKHNPNKPNNQRNNSFNYNLLARCNYRLVSILYFWQVFLGMGKENKNNIG
jgi:hypothetical protein